MRGFWPLTWSEFKLALRDPMLVFWSLVFPTLWLVLRAGVIPPIPGFGYEGLNDGNLYLPAAISLVILCSSFVGVPLMLTNYRETAVLRRLRVTPVKSLTLVSAFAVSQFAFMITGVLLLMLVGYLVFDVRVLGSGVVFAGVIVLGMVTFLALGSAIGGIARSSRAANIIIWTIFAPMLMLSGLFIPISVFPAWLQPIAKVLPLAPLNTMLREIVYGVPLGDLWQLGVMATWIIIAGIITVRFFRWE